MFSNRVLFRTGVFASCLQIASGAHAQTPPKPPPQPPVTIKEQVEVVATRLPEAPHDVPASIEVIDGDTLRAIGATNIREALALAAGDKVRPGRWARPSGCLPPCSGPRRDGLVIPGVGADPCWRSGHPDIPYLLPART